MNEALDLYTINRWQEFASAATESAYRASALPGEVQRARLLLWLTAFGAVLFISQDFVTFGLSLGFYLGIAIRLAAVAMCLGALWRLRRPITPGDLQQWVMLFACMLTLLVLFGYVTRPVPRMGHGLIALTVFALGMATPMRFRQQLVASVSFFAVAMAALALKRPEPFLLYGTFFVTVLCVALSTITAASIHRTQRESFAAKREAETAMAEIRTLRGLLPICASCKNIRRDDGAWSRIESYVTEHTHVKFTHGICPDCRERLYPETLEP